MAKRRILILGGTAEARELAACAVSRFGDRLDVMVSLAGRTRTRADYAGEVRIGGFGGAEGLARFLERERIDLLVDATHPFAARMAAHAHDAATAAKRPLLVLQRPMWREQPGDNWIVVASAAAAAAAARSLGRRIFVSFGGHEIAAFAALTDAWLLVRRIEPGDLPLPRGRYELSLGRGPFSLANERELLRHHRIEVVVTKASGGTATRAKLDAARELGIPVVLIQRPVQKTGPTVATVEEAVCRIADLLLGHGAIDGKGALSA